MPANKLWELIEAERLNYFLGSAVECIVNANSEDGDVVAEMTKASRLLHQWLEIYYKEAYGEE